MLEMFFSASVLIKKKHLILDSDSAVQGHLPFPEVIVLGMAKLVQVFIALTGV